MPQKHHYIISPDDDRVFDVSTERPFTASRFDVHTVGSSSTDTHESSLVLPKQIHTESATHNIAEYTAIQPYKGKIYAAARTQNNVWHIFEIDELNKTESTGRIWHNPGRKVYDLTLFNNDTLFWADGSTGIKRKLLNADVDATEKLVPFETGASATPIKAVAAYKPTTGNDTADRVLASAQKALVPATLKSTTFRVQNRNGEGEVIRTGYLKIELKASAGNTVTISSRTYTNVWFMLRTAAAHDTASAVLVGDSGGNAPAGSGRTDLQLRVDTSGTSATIFVTLKNSSDGSGVTTLSEIADVINSSNDDVIGQFTVTVTGDENAFIDWDSNADNDGNRGMAAWLLGTHTSRYPGNPFFDRFGDYGDGSRPHTPYNAGSAQVSKLFYAKAELTTGVEWLTARANVNTGDGAITYLPTGLVLTGNVQFYMAKADGTIYKGKIEEDMTTFADSALDDENYAEIRESQGFGEDNITTLSYEHTDSYLHVEGESLISLQGLTLATVANARQGINLYDGHDKSLIIMHAENSSRSMANIHGLEMPIHSGIISYDHVTANGGGDGTWLLTTFSSE